MEIITLEEIKAQCRIDSEDNSEDTLLTSYGDAAEQMVQNYIKRDSASLLEDYGEVPAPIRTAMLILVAQYYKYREASTQDAVNDVPWGIQTLLRPYVKLIRREEEP